MFLVVLEGSDYVQLCRVFFIYFYLYIVWRDDCLYFPIRLYTRYNLHISGLQNKTVSSILFLSVTCGYLSTKESASLCLRPIIAFVEPYRFFLLLQ